MSTSPVSPEDIRAAAEAHRELGPEYSDAVVAAFIEKVDREVAARVEARLASTARTRSARPEGSRPLLKGMAIGVCAGALTVAGIGLAVPRGVSVNRHAVPAPAVRDPTNVRLMPAYILRAPRIARPPIPARPSR